MRHSSVRIFYSLAMILAVLLPASVGRVSAQQAPTIPAAPAALIDDIQLQVTAASSLDAVVAGQAITQYRWMINVDNTGDPLAGMSGVEGLSPMYASGACNPYLDAAHTQRNPDYPELCDWPSLRNVPGWAPIYASGTQADLSLTTALMDLPAGNYLLQVTAEGFKIDGEHFTIPLEAPGLIKVALQPEPLPTSTMVIKVFNDNASTNGQYDGPAELGLAGFRASVNDIAGEITTDMFGSPLCTVYEKDAAGAIILDGDGLPVVAQIGQGCYSDAEGLITIPNLGTIRFDVLVIPPDGQQWLQTTTLEGSQGWDTWLQEGGTGLDNEFIIGGEPFPWTMFGFVAPTNTLPSNAPQAGSIRGRIMRAEVFVPFEKGLPYQGDIWQGQSGAKLDRPIDDAWLAVNDLQNSDQAVWVGKADAAGHFDIGGLPPGNYSVTYWDEKQHHILDFFQVAVRPGEHVDMGVRFLTGWFSEWSGTVFFDYNENGRRDSNEPGVPDYLIVLKDRENTEIDRMSISSVTDENGFWEIPKGYPMGSWMVLEGYSDIYKSTGYTYQASNQTEPTTVLEGAVDVSVLPVLGQKGRLDWGVKFYNSDENGGIGGTVFYDTVRAEDDGRYAGAEPWQPGIPNLEVKLFNTVKDIDGNFVMAADGSYQKGDLLAVTTTEHYLEPRNCIYRDANGEPMDWPALPPYDPSFAPGNYTDGYPCVEGPMSGIQFGHGQAALDGNFGIGEITHNPDGTPKDPADVVPLPAGDYLLEVVIPNDALGHPMFQVTREEDQNIFSGDTFTPSIPPPACAGPLHTVHVTNPDSLAVGGSRFEGQQKPLCNVRLINLTNGKAVAPGFYLWTEVPIPGKWKGYIIDDLNLSSNPFELFFGEKVGLSNMPVGIYDFTGRRVHTVYSDPNGVYEVLLPASESVNTPTPSGMNAGMYYIYGNDPGTAANPNRHVNPQYRSIGATFEIYPGNMMPSDLALVENGARFKSPGARTDQASQCTLEDTQPQIYRVNKPYATRTNTTTPVPLTITGFAFGATQGTGQVLLGNNLIPVTAWTDRAITIAIPGRLQAGPYSLEIVTGAGARTVNGLTFHYLGAGYNPRIYEVGPGLTGPRQFDPANPKYDGTVVGPIQEAIDAAAAANVDSLVVVYPGVQSPIVALPGVYTNVYFENLILYKPVKLQGVGPGGFYPDAPAVQGTVIDGRGTGGDQAYTTTWRDHAAQIWAQYGWDGSLLDNDGRPTLYEGPVISVFARNNGFRQNFNAAIDGFVIQGGDQQGFPNNLNQIVGGQNGLQPNVVIQGGGIFVNAYARYLQITNNVIQANGGAYGGGIRVGTPYLLGNLTDSQNDNLKILHNRIIANGGTNLAGGIGLFNGSEGYEIAYNDLCGNYSAEYGGGISHYGRSGGSSIHHNRIYFNVAYDEAGGVMIAGELPANVNQLSVGAGPVQVYNNLIQSNLSNDDGGGLRYLMAGNFPYTVYNNIIANNVSAHEGGGISLNDTPNIRIYNNTIAKNITTATAMSSDGLPAPAGLSSARHSVPLQNSLPFNAAKFSDPLLFNNLFWDNRAGTWTGGGVSGVGMQGDPMPIFHWDLGVGDASGVLSPSNSLFQVAYDENPAVTNIVGQDPLFVQEFTTTITTLAWRGNPNFVNTTMVTLAVPPKLMGDYHLQAGSPAVNAGAAQKPPVQAPNQDIDRGPRPSNGGYEIGADELAVTFPATPPLVLAPAVQAQAPQVEALTAQSQAAQLIFLPFVRVKYILGANWLGQNWGYEADGDTVFVSGGGAVLWNSPQPYGGDQEAYFHFTALAAAADHQDLLLKAEGLGADGALVAGTRLVTVHYDRVNQALAVETLQDGVWTQHDALYGVDFQAGDRFGARVADRGIVEVYRNQQLVLTTDLTAGGSRWPQSGVLGRIGVWFNSVNWDGLNTAGFRSFGGGTMP